MKKAYEKYIPFVPLKMERRAWPDKQITKAPIWCSVDLRDGNQALVDPMNLQEKLEYFHTLVDIGVKEIEIGFPSASETEYEICRELIEGGHIPDDVTIQVLVQARPHLIQKTFEAIRGAKHVILHFYNSTSTLQRKVVFHMDMDGITKIATDAAKLIYELSQPVIAEGMDLRYEYSPESFMGTEMDYAVEICQAVIEAIHATPEKKIILNLPTTVENCMPNYFADELEYFISKLPSRDSAIISLHPHNDRGCGVATAEMGLLAGAERIEATLFGNGERTGNVDMVTLALNMHTQGVDPELDFSDINKIKSMYERCTKMKVSERQPYAGELVFTAFSGSHQDAINKGTAYMEESGSEYWEIPYLPIDPADVGRQYEPIIRINSQSGKGGAAYVMHHNFGFDLPKAMHPEFGHIVQVETDRVGTELKP
ncbi:2-isopropylmalate synthase, partial [uncultured Pseudoflavonifractor sp.]|uniref:2-isopropylmalate synthase n=1 Tax=uncultured Pseudoflavonifractor sp. TaxID=1221379 RepID=UPI0025E3C547